jgi:hypothetical protein
MKTDKMELKTRTDVNAQTLKDELSEKIVSIVWQDPLL